MSERASWPLLGRPALIDEICHGLLGRPPRTALVTGLAGAGKTTLLAELAARLRTRHRRIVDVVGIAELSSVPLGALLPVLTATTEPDATVSERLRGLLEQLGRDADRTVLLVDDASFLDDVSAAAVYQLIRAFGVPTVVTARHGGALPPALDRLRHEDAVREHAVPPLTHAEVATLLARRLGGGPTPELLNTLWSRTEGNPLFLRGLVEGALARTGPRRTDHGLDVPIDAVADIGTLTDRLLIGLDDELLRATQLVALTGGLDELELARAGASDAARRLRERELAVTTEEGRTRLAHPLLAEAAQRSLGAHPVERVREAADLLDAGDDSRRLAAVRLLLAAGIMPESDRLAAAATTAARTGIHPLCAELARAAIAAGDSDAGLRWTLAGSLSLLGRLDEADEVFAEGWELARTPEERALGVSLNGEHLAFRRLDPPAALRLAEHELAALPPHLRAVLESEVRGWRAIAGVLADGSPAAPDTAAPPAVRVRSAMATVLSESLAGRGDLAHASAATIAAIHREFGALDPVAAAMVQLERFFHHLARADGAAAWAVIEKERSGPLTDAAGIWTYTLGVYCWYDGRLEEGARLAALAVEQLRWRDPTGLRGAAVVLGALVGLALGREEESQQMLAALAPTQLAEPRAAMLHAEYAATRLAANGHDAEAAELLRAAGTAAVENGHALVGALTLSLAIRLGRARTVRDGLTRAAKVADVDNRLLPALRDLASAVADSDVAAVLASSRTVASAGMRATARDALLRTASTGSLSATDARRLVAAARDHDATPSGDDQPTAREREVAELAARRLSNTEIAASLGVSVRTVENHLTRYYAKTGSSRRRLRQFSREP